MGSSNENSAFGPVHNPWALDRIPGGTSGGSAATVAASITPLALGSDTGGSIRQPAAMCGVVGLKPTYGRVSRYGLIAFGSSLDQIGPLTRTVHDAALALGVIAGADAADATSAPEPVADYAAALTGDIRGTAHGRAGAAARTGRRSRKCRARVQSVARRAGRPRRHARRHRICRTRSTRRPCTTWWPPPRRARTSRGMTACAMDFARRLRSAVHATPRSRRAATCTREPGSCGFGPEVKRRIMLGTYVLSAGYYEAYYLKAQQVRTLILRDYEHAFERVDVVAMPTSPTPAFKLGERVADPLQMYLADVFTVSANLAGLPGDQRALRLHARAPADRPAADRTAIRRGHTAADRGCLRTRHGLVESPEIPSGRSSASLDPQMPMSDPEWAAWPDEKLLDVRICDLGVSIAGTELEQRIAQINAELDVRGLRFRPHLLAVRRVVHARRRPRRGHPLLPGASAAGQAGARADARSGRRRSRVVPDDPAARGRPRHRQRL